MRHKLKGPLEIGSLTNMVLKLLTLWKVYGENMPKLVSFLLGKLDKKTSERETFCSEFEIFVRKNPHCLKMTPKVSLDNLASEASCVNLNFLAKNKTTCGKQTFLSLVFSLKIPMRHFVRFSNTVWVALKGKAWTDIEKVCS